MNEKPEAAMLQTVSSDIAKAGRYLAQGFRLMVGVPSYDVYLRHMQLAHPDKPAMTYEEFFNERQAARYGGGNGRCC